MQGLGIVCAAASDAMPRHVCHACHVCDIGVSLTSDALLLTWQLSLVALGPSVFLRALNVRRLNYLSCPAAPSTVLACAVLGTIVASTVPVTALCIALCWHALAGGHGVSGLGERSRLGYQVSPGRFMDRRIAT